MYRPGNLALFVDVDGKLHVCDLPHRANVPTLIILTEDEACIMVTEGVHRAPITGFVWEYVKRHAF